MKFSVRAFSGMRPCVSPDLLSAGSAVDASDVVLQGGDLDPLRSPLFVANLSATASTVKAIYRFGQDLSSDSTFWFQSNNEANFVRGPLDDDTEERTYYTGHLSYPTKTRAGTSATGAAPYPTTSYPMGLYMPASAPTGTVTGTPTVADSVAEDVAYVVTLITAWGEEGPPSSPSAIYSWRAGQSISLVLPTSGAPSYPGNATKSGQVYVAKRVYRSSTGASGSARWLLVNTEGDIPMATAGYTDNKITANLGEMLATKGWVEPPDDMVGLTQMANGILAGYSGNTVCFSHPFYPYAWPVRYQQSVDAPVVGMAAFDQSLLVSTTRSLYVISGTDPSSLTSQRLPDPQACIARRAMVSMLGGVVFPTPDGVGFVGPSGFSMLSDGLFTRREWIAYTTNPSSMHAYEIDGAYVLFLDNGTQGCLVFKFGSEPSLSRSTVYATAGFRDPGRDALFLCIPGTGTSRAVYKWDGGSSMTFQWKSGVFRLPSPANLGAARIHASGDVTFELYADGSLVAGPYTITSSSPFKLPGTYRSQRYQFRVSSSSVVRSVEIGSTVKDVISE